MQDDANPPLRRGWTTGACATAATKAAMGALAGHGFADPVMITLPSGQRVAFSLALQEMGEGFTRAAIVKDAGDDPDVTHGAVIIATLRPLAEGQGVQFLAGQGVGTITRAGLPLPVGEPAINPVPRQMMQKALLEICGTLPNVSVEISIENGEKLAERTLNGRLGIVGGLSVLGTTGIVVPYSCAAWIASIHRGIDVARAAGLTHLAAATGSTSEKAVQAFYNLPDIALIDMGDFVGGTLKYLKMHPVSRMTLAGGMGKITKLAQGLMDLHSKRGSVDLDFLSEEARNIGGNDALCALIKASNTALEAFSHAQHLPLANHICSLALDHAKRLCPNVQLDLLMIDREGLVIGSANGV